MSKPESVRSRYGARYGEMREQVFPLWRGPGSITVRDLGGEPFYGWRVLLFAARLDWPLRIESRAVYAHLFDDTQKTAVLRAMSWDGSPARRSVEEQGQQAKLIVPVQFIQLPIERIHNWLSAFKDMSIVAEQTLTDDATIPIRTLRVEWEYTSCVVETVWRSQNARHAALQGAWQRVWEEMTHMLHTAPALPPAAGVEEDFEIVPAETSAYDLQTYRPDWFPFPTP